MSNLRSSSARWAITEVGPARLAQPALVSLTHSHNGRRRPRSARKWAGPSICFGAAGRRPSYYRCHPNCALETAMLRAPGFLCAPYTLTKKAPGPENSTNLISKRTRNLLAGPTAPLDHQGHAASLTPPPPR